MDERDYLDHRARSARRIPIVAAVFFGALLIFLAWAAGVLWNSLEI